MVGGAFWLDPGVLSCLIECQLPDSLSPASQKGWKAKMYVCADVAGEKDVKFLVSTSGRVGMGETFSRKKLSFP